MKWWSNLLVALLLFAGVSILLYPTISNWIASRNHSKAIVEYAVTVDELAEQEIETHLAQAREYNLSLTGIVSEDAFSDADFELPEEYLSILNVNGMIGYVSIPSIDVNLPVYHTVSPEVLRRGAGHMPDTAFPVGGADCHTVLTAHRGLPSARLFTDLNKLEQGDLFYLHVLDKTLCYQVDQILVVEPFETDALQPLAGEDLTTLVTCTPYAINSHRLLVRGTRTESSAEDSVLENLEQALERDVWMIGVIALAVLAVVFLALLAVRRRRAGARRG